MSRRTATTGQVTAKVTAVVEQVGAVQRAGVVVGVGGRPGSQPEDLATLVAATLEFHGIDRDAVALVVTVDRRADERGVRELTVSLGAALIAYDTTTLAAQQVPHPSEVVSRALGTASVSEAAVLAAGGTLIAPKQSSAQWTVAVGRIESTPAAPE